jgi:ParB-like chromosome segregation protein Spo0J
VASVLKKKVIAVKELKPMKDNVKKHPIWQIERLVHSISTYSEKEPVLLQPLVVDEKNTVLIGNGRLEAIKQLEWKKVEVIIKSGLSKEQKKALSILDNKSISTEWNEDLLAQQLPELDDLALDTGFSEKEIRDLIKKADAMVGGQIDAEPVYDLSPKLHEKYDYIMLFFDNEVDFLFAQQLLKLKKVKDRMKQNKVGMCRAIKGMEAIETIKKSK